MQQEKPLALLRNGIEVATNSVTGKLFYSVQETQAINVVEPRLIGEDGVNAWQFTFGIEHEGIFDDGNDTLGLLKQDVHGVPMIVGLDETYQEGFLMPYMLSTGDNANIYFKLIQDISEDF